MPNISITELQSDLSEYLDGIEDGRDELVVVRPRGKPVVIITQSDWEGMKETLYLLGNPANAEHLRASIADCEAGRTFERDLIEN